MSESRRRGAGCGCGPGAAAWRVTLSQGLRRGLALGWLLGAGALAWMRALPAAEPSTVPQMRIDAGMHTLSVRSIATDAAGRLVLTCSQDKTARLWSLERGGAEGGFRTVMLRTLRVPIGPGNEGMLHACALSPDGRLAAVGGWTGDEWDGSFCIYFFDTATGRLLRRIAELPGVVHGLAFSPSGTRLAAGLHADVGMRVWDVASSRQLCHDAVYDDTCFGLDWLGEETLAATGWDGRVRLYHGIGKMQPQTPDGSVMISPVRTAEIPLGVRPTGIRFSPDGQWLAVGFDDCTAVAILDSQDLGLLYQSEPTKDKNQGLCQVAWSRDGRHLAAGGGWVQKNQCPIRIWPVSQSGLGTPVDLRVGSTNTLHEILPLPWGGFIFATSDPAWGIIQPQVTELGAGETRGREAVGAEVPAPDLPLEPPEDAAPPQEPQAPPPEVAWTSWLLGLPPIADHRKDSRRFQVSADGTVAAFNYLPFNMAPASFSLSDRHLLLGETPRVLHAPRMEGLELTDWELSKHPKLGGKPLLLDEHETARCMAISPDASTFVLGADWTLRGYTADGTQRWERPAPGVVWGVNFSTDGRVLVVFYGDGTLRWHRPDDGEELLAFLAHADRKRWVLWTPAGWYDCSAGGDKLIGWHVNRGQENAADFQPADTFLDTWYRPDIVDELIRTWDTEAAVRLANARRGKVPGPVAEPADGGSAAPPPVVELTVGGPSHTLHLPADVRETTLTCRTPMGSPPPTRWRVLVDGRPVDARISPPRTDIPAAEMRIAVPLPAHDCTVALLAGDRRRFSEPALLTIRRPAPAPDKAAGKAAAKAAAGKTAVKPAPKALKKGAAKAVVKTAAKAAENAAAKIAENAAAKDAGAAPAQSGTGAPAKAAAEAAPAPADDGRGCLYVVAIGVTRLKNREALPGLLAPKYAIEDATAFASLLMGQRQLYASSERRLLIEEKATASGIRNALDRYISKARSGDTLLVMLAGPGESDAQGRYTFCPYDYDRARRLTTGVSVEDLRSMLGEARSQVLLFLDAFSPPAGEDSGKGNTSAHANASATGNANAGANASANAGAGESGCVDVAGLANALSDTASNIVVFASHDGRRIPLVSDTLKQGLFFSSVQQGLQGRADSQQRGLVTLSMLRSFVEGTMRRAGKEQQNPVISIPRLIPDLTLSRKPEPTP